MPEQPAQGLVEQRYAIAEGAASLYLMGHGERGGVWQVWLNRKHDFDGLLLGHGATREEALEAATNVLLEGVRALRAITNGAGEAAQAGGS